MYDRYDFVFERVSDYTPLDVMYRAEYVFRINVWVLSAV